MEETKPTYTEKLTLAEIAENDLEMVRDAIKNSIRYNFGKDMKKAVMFVRHCMDVTFRRLGMTSPQPPTNCISPASRARFAAKLDAEMKEKEIRIEQRNKYTGSDLWRCGIYIFQKDVLVCFISDVLTKRTTEANPMTFGIGREEIGYMVITNAELDETKKIYVMPANTLEKLPVVGGVQ